MKPHFQSRIHLEWVDVSGFVVSYMDKAEKGFAFQHNADEEVNRTHVHSYFFSPTVETKSYSEQVAKKLGLKGQHQFYTSDKCSKKDKRALDISGAWCYGSKWGTIAPVFTKNISPDLVDELQKYAKSKATMGNIASGTIRTEMVILKEIQLKTKPTQYEHAKKCAAMVLERHPQILTTLDGSTQENLTNIFNVAYEYFRTSGLYMGKYKQLDFMDMVMVHINAADYRNILLNNFIKRNSYV